MATPSKQRFLIALSAVLVGCTIGATMPRLAAQSFPANPAAPRWEQFCERPDGSEVNRTLSVRGAAGFELVSTSYHPGTNVLVCFKRPAAR